jgi:hypothetical protein
LDFKKLWSDGTASCDLEPLALLARLAALVPPPRRHLTLYCGVLSSHARLRSQVVPQASTEATATEQPQNPARKTKYIPWAELLRRTFAIDIRCAKCGSPLRLIALIKTREVIEKILVAMHLPADVPELHPARPPPGADREARDREDQLDESTRPRARRAGVGYAACSPRPSPDPSPALAPASPAAGWRRNTAGSREWKGSSTRKYPLRFDFLWRRMSRNTIILRRAMLLFSRPASTPVRESDRRRRHPRAEWLHLLAPGAHGEEKRGR